MSDPLICIRCGGTANATWDGLCRGCLPTGRNVNKEQRQNLVEKQVKFRVENAEHWLEMAFKDPQSQTAYLELAKEQLRRAREVLRIELSKED